MGSFFRGAPQRTVERRRSTRALPSMTPPFLIISGHGFLVERGAAEHAATTPSALGPLRSSRHCRPTQKNGGQNGGQNGEDMVSRVGIEPTTRRLRVSKNG
jgi:hypothetical protein